jgi:SAM-dependent methyltransferase
MMEDRMNSKKPLRVCPTCRGAVWAEVIHTQRFVLPVDHLLPREYDIVVCGECGFVYADTSASQDVYEAYYASTSQYCRDYINKDTRLYTDTVAWLGTFINDKKAAIIEVGCGNGQLLTELQMAGFSDLTALDPSAVCIDTIRAKGITGLCGSLFEVSGGRQYNCVILQGGLEHIYDIPKTMSIVRTLTKSGGFVFIGVPDASRYGDYDTIPYDYFNIEHINHFEETSLINLDFLYGFNTIGFLKSVLRLSRVEQPVIFCMYQKTGREKMAGWQSHARQAVVDYTSVTQANQSSVRIINELAGTAEQIVVLGGWEFYQPPACDIQAGAVQYHDVRRQRQAQTEDEYPWESCVCSRSPFKLAGGGLHCCRRRSLS